MHRLFGAGVFWIDREPLRRCVIVLQRRDKYRFAAHDDLVDRFSQVVFRFLLKECDVHIGLADDPPRVDCLTPRENREQRRLAGPVPANNPDPVVRCDAEARAGKEWAPVLGLRRSVDARYMHGSHCSGARHRRLETEHVPGPLECEYHRRRL